MLWRWAAITVGVTVAGVAPAGHTDASTSTFTLDVLPILLALLTLAGVVVSTVRLARAHRNRDDDDDDGTNDESRADENRAFLVLTAQLGDRMAELQQCKEEINRMAVEQASLTAERDFLALRVASLENPAKVNPEEAGRVL